MRRCKLWRVALVLAAVGCGDTEAPCPEISLVPAVQPLAVAPTGSVALPLYSPAGTEPLLLCNRPVACPADSVRVHSTPDVAVGVTLAADGGALLVRPATAWPAGTEVRLEVEADVFAPGPALGAAPLAGRFVVRVRQAVRLAVERTSGNLPLRLDPDAVSALVLSDWASRAPEADATGLGQREWIVGLIEKRDAEKGPGGQLAMWAVEAEPGARGGVRPRATGAVLAWGGRFVGDAVVLNLSAPRGRRWPWREVGLAGRLSPDLRLRAASAYVEADAWPAWLPDGLVHRWPARHAAAATFATRAYPPGGTANRRPRGVKVTELRYLAPTEQADGHAIVEIGLAKGARYPVAEHRGGVLLLDPVRHVPVPLDYATNSRQHADAAGNLARIELVLPAGSIVPDTIDVVVLADVFPLHYETLTTRAR